MERGLSRIILIDSYMPGRATEVVVSGHTSINGRNGAGKTSLLRLVPIFYGEQPRNLVTKTASGRKGFASWYLPRDASSLVFEYRGADGDLKMVVFRPGAAAESYHQVLVDSPYDESLFVDVERQKFLPSSELLPRLTARGLPYYVCKSNEEYRSILMDGTIKNHMRYSMVSRNARLGAVVPLVTHMFQRNVSFEHFAEIIQDYARNNLSADARNKLAQFKPNRGHLNELVEHYRAFTALDALMPRLAEITTGLADLRHHKERRAAAALAAQAKNTQLLREIDELTRALEAENASFRARGGEVEVEVATAKESRERVARALREKRAQQKLLAATRHQYEKDDLPTKARQLNQLPGKLQELAERERERQRLVSDLALAEGPINEAMSSERQRAHEATIQHQVAMASEQAAYEGERTRLADRHQAAAEKLKSRHDAEAVRLQDAARNAREACVRLEALLEHPKVDPAVLSQLDFAEALHDSLTEEAKQASEVREKARNEKNAAQSRYGEADLQYDRLRHDADKAEEELKRAKERLVGGPDSLIHFLNEQLPDWANTLGRVISPSVLRQKGLSPERVASADATVFGGVRLDVSTLPAPETPEELQSAFEDAVKARDAAEQRVAQAEKALNEAADRRESATKACQKAESSADIVERKRREAREALSNARAALRDAERQAQTRLQADLAAATAAREAAESELATRLRIQATVREDLAEAHSAAIADLNRKRDATLAQLRDAQSAAESAHRAAMARLEKQLASARADSGVDPDDIARLDGDILRLTQQCEEMRGWAALVAAYQDFLDNEWPAHDEAEEAAAELQDQVDQIDAALQTLGADWQEEERGFKQRIAAIENTLTLKRQESSIIAPGSALREATDNPGLMAAEALIDYFQALPAEKLEREHLDEHRKVQACMKALGSVVSGFVSSFQRHSGSPSHVYWVEREAAWAGLDDPTVTQAKAIEDYFENQGHEQARNQLIQAFNYISTLDNYRLGLEAFENGVRTFNRDLLAHLEQDLKFDLINRVAPKITLDLSELDFWKDLTRLADLYRDWSRSGRRVLPDPELVKAVEAYSQTVRNDRGRQEDFSSLIRFRFELVIEGRPMTAVNAAQLEDISSNGLSSIVLILLFQAFVDLVRGQHQVTMLWPLDELGTIDATNRRVLFKMLAEHDISLLTATPDLRPADLAHFNEAYELAIEDGHRRLIQMQWPGQRVAPTPPDDLGEHKDAS